jgi:4-amino-4-deoxy-L-arabinose transferase-like glycosyltransferase
MSVFWPLRTQTVVGPVRLDDAVAAPAAPAETPVTTTPSTSRGRSGWVIILGLSFAVLVLHLATNGLYGFHRDELYYLDSARHLAWGFVDYPPLTPAVARLSELVFGTSVWGLRLWPSVAGALMVVLAAQIARELGGGHWARVLAAVGAAASPVLLGANWLFATVTFDQVTWLTCIWVTARLIRTGDRRLWLALGAAAGMGLETKYTIVALIAGLAAGVAVSPLRRHLRSRWPWFGLGLALLIFLPNIIWQVANGWPSIAYTVNHHAAQSSDFAPLIFLSDQLALIGPLAVAVWLAGWRWLLSAGRRALGVAALVVFFIYLLAGKGYYIGPLHPLLVAAGACAVEAWTLQRTRWLRPMTTVALVLQAVVLMPIAIPILPEAVMARSTLPSIRTDFADTVGWQDLVAQVDAIYKRLPARDRSGTVLLTGNYGEAGAINTYGPPQGLPTAVSGELTYYYWKPVALDGPVIGVGLDAAFLTTLFSGCSQVATISNAYGLQNQEAGTPVVLCARPRFPLDQLWPRLKSFQ